MPDTLLTTGGEPSPQSNAGDTGTATTTQPASASFVNQDGSFVDGWQMGLGDEYAGLGKFKTVSDLAKSYSYLERKQPHYPTEESSAEDVARFRALAGVPDSAEGYELKAPDDLPESVAWNEEEAKKYAEVAHKYHVPPAALKALAQVQVESEVARVAAMEAAQVKALEDGRSDLKKTWGHETDAKLGTVKLVYDKLLAKVGVDPSSEEAANLARSPLFIKLAYQMSGYMGEDNTPRTPAGGSSFAGAKERALDIINNSNNPQYQLYYNGDPSVTAFVRQALTS